MNRRFTLQEIHDEHLERMLPGAHIFHDGENVNGPVIVILGGSEGDDYLIHHKAKHFVSAGFIALGLPYYSPPDENGEQKFPALPERLINIPLELLQSAIDWLNDNRQVSCSAIGLYGVSKGAEMALAAASKMPGIDAVAAIVPTDVIWEGLGRPAKDEVRSSFSWKGTPLPYVAYQAQMFDDEQRIVHPELSLRQHMDKGRLDNIEMVSQARIRVEDIQCHTLVAGSRNDQVWSSGQMALAVAERRAEHDLPTTCHIFDVASHNVSGNGAEEIPGFQLSEEDKAAQKILWPATLAFFQQSFAR